MTSFWKNLPRPFLCLAPMADVTDAAFRRVIAKYGKPDVMWTEFVSADGLFKGGFDVLSKDLAYTQAERPIVAQFFSREPELMERAGALARELGFDGIDINMGCPDSNVCKQGAGAALIKEPKLARELIRATKRGAHGLPVSVKTRIGYGKPELDVWLPELLAEEPAAVTLHARTKKEMSKIAARWEEVARAVKIRDGLRSETLIIGNGDVRSAADACTRAEESGCDGVMVGRGIFGNPWFFSGYQPTLREKLSVLAEHTGLFEELLPHKNLAVMKKHFKAYVEGFAGAKELRARLMGAPDATAVSSIIADTLKNLDASNTSA